MDSSNAVVLNESLTLAAASPGGRNVDWESKAPLTMRSSEPKCVVEKKTGQPRFQDVIRRCVHTAACKVGQSAKSSSLF